MARYNSVNTTTSVAGGTTISTPASGLLTTLTGSGTVVVPNPVLYTGQTQTFYNSTGSAITLSTPSGVFTGPGTGSSVTINLSGGAILTIVSDGTNYVTQAWLGGPVTVGGTLTANSTVNIGPSNANVSIQPTGTGTLTLSSGSTGSLDNVNIGATTPGTGSFTTLSSTGITQVTAGTASTAYNNGALIVSGGVGIGGKVNINNSITAGTAGSTSGSIILQGNYGNGALVTFGSEYSSGGPSIGYSVYPSSTGTGTFLSSTGLANNRSAYTLSGQQHTWYMGTSQTVAVGSPVAMYTAMSLSNTALTVSNASNLVIQNTTASPTNSYSPPGYIQLTGFGWNTLGGSTQYQGQVALGGGYSSTSGSTEPAITFSLAGTGNSGYNALSGPSSLTERVRITNYGNIGVGTTTPQATLDMGSRTDAIILPVGTTAQRPATGIAGMMRYNSTTGYIEYYYPNTSSWVGIGQFSATSSGTILTPNSGALSGYVVHVFTSSGTFTVNAGSKSVNYLIVAGGGAGGWDVGGGGGAGGLLQSTVAVVPGGYTVTVGAGGVSLTTGGSSAGTSGNNSSFSAVGTTAIGGGGGGNWSGNFGQNGGSGGGEVSNVSGYQTGTVGQGNNGGASANNLTPSSNDYAGASGGGGAGAAGGNGINSAWGAASTTYAYGGNGLYFSVLSQLGYGSPAGWFAGGGGASSDSGTYYGVGGNGGGSTGGQNRVHGIANTGGGGGGAGSLANSQSGISGNQGSYGGSGIVIIWYQP